MLENITNEEKTWSDWAVILLTNVENTEDRTCEKWSFKNKNYKEIVANKETAEIFLTH